MTDRQYTKTHIQAQIQVPWRIWRSIDQVLARLMPDYSRARLTQWLTDGQVLVDGARLKPKNKVVGGEQIVIENLRRKLIGQPKTFLLISFMSTMI